MDYTLQRKKQLKRINLKVKADGEVLVTAPLWTPKRIIDQFVSDNHKWISSKQESSDKFRIRDGLELGELTIVNDQDVGDEYRYDASDRELMVNLDDLGRARSRIDKFITDKAKSALPALVEQLAQQAEQQVQRVVIKNTKSRWGSCSSKGNINLSKYVWLLPYKLRHYVVAHEVSHLKHLNHSKEFWNFVETLHADFRFSRKEIKSYSGLLGCLDNQTQ